MTDFITTIQTFVKTLDSDTVKMMDELQETGYDNKYDFKVSVNGNEITIPNNADTYLRLVDFMLNEIMDIVDIKSHLERIKKLAAWQWVVATDNDGEQQPWFITFDHCMQEIYEPFVSTCMRFNVDPVTYYGKQFLLSDWFNEHKVSALEVRYANR